MEDSIHNPVTEMGNSGNVKGTEDELIELVACEERWKEERK
jgi:hypothetical protein